MVLITAITLRVSAPGPHDLDRCSYRFSLYQLRVLVIIGGGILKQQSHPGVCADIIMTPALFHRVPVTGRPRENILLRDTKKAADKFGPLKAVLEAIPPVYVDREVCNRPPSQNPPLTNTFLGIDRCEKQD